MTYQVIRPDDPNVNLNAPVEGFRNGWLDRVIANCPRVPRADEQPAEWKSGVALENQMERHQAELSRASYMSALYALVAEFLPPAFMRAEPVARFQHQLESAVVRLKRADESGEQSGVVAIVRAMLNYVPSARALSFKLLAGRYSTPVMSAQKTEEGRVLYAAVRLGGEGIEYADITTLAASYSDAETLAGTSPFNRDELLRIAPLELHELVGVRASSEAHLPLPLTGEAAQAAPIDAPDMRLVEAGREDYDEEPPDEDPRTSTWLEYTILAGANGYDIQSATNDDDGDGYDDSHVTRGDYHLASLRGALMLTGACRVGAGGLVVTVKFGDDRVERNEHLEATLLSIIGDIPGGQNLAAIRYSLLHRQVDAGEVAMMTALVALERSSAVNCKETSNGDLIYSKARMPEKQIA